MKFMIMNYKPYEYELLLDKLNSLGKEGYLTNDLSIFTTFNKVTKPVFYKIDFYRPEGENSQSKKEDEFAFIERYRLKGYTNIYKKHNMYVFYTMHKNDTSIDWEMKDDVCKHSFRLLSLVRSFFSILLFSMILYYSSIGIYDKFKSYGILIAFLGILLLLLAAAYRNYLNFYGMTLFNSRLKKSKPFFNKNKLSLSRKPYSIMFIIASIMMVGGLIEDTFNAQSFTPQEHPVVTLQDIGLNNKTEISSQKYSGFIVPHTYITLDKSKDYGLYIREYEYIHSEDTLKLFKQLQSTPIQYGANNIKVKDHVIYGYYDQDIVSLVIHKDQSIIFIIPSFALSTSQIEDIISFYQV